MNDLHPDDRRLDAALDRLLAASPPPPASARGDLAARVLAQVRAGGAQERADEARVEARLDELLASRPVAAGPAFAAGVQDRVRSGADPLDDALDAWLAEPAVAASAEFTARALERVRSEAGSVRPTAPSPAVPGPRPDWWIAGTALAAAAAAAFVLLVPEPAPVAEGPVALAPVSTPPPPPAAKRVSSSADPVAPESVAAFATFAADVPEASAIADEAVPYAAFAADPAAEAWAAMPSVAAPMASAPEPAPTVILEAPAFVAATSPRPSSSPPPERVSAFAPPPATGAPVRLQSAFAPASLADGTRRAAAPAFVSAAGAPEVEPAGEPLPAMDDILLLADGLTGLDLDLDDDSITLLGLLGP